MRPSLCIELDTMTRELTNRYEELNLVYHTDDQIKLFREGRDALTKLVENCRDYLNVAFATLIMRDQQITIVQNDVTNPLDSVAHLLRQLSGPLYGWILQSQDTAVINGPDEALFRELELDLPYRILACPVFGSANAVTGLLVTLNRQSRRAFSNSDRNLIKVMSRKAGKIIQTATTH